MGINVYGTWTLVRRWGEIKMIFENSSIPKVPNRVDFAEN